LLSVCLRFQSAIPKSAVGRLSRSGEGGGTSSVAFIDRERGDTTI
jgi:hypothetical protein